jgi:hypothetical protein
MYVVFVLLCLVYNWHSSCWASTLVYIYWIIIIIIIINLNVLSYKYFIIWHYKSILKEKTSCVHVEFLN